MKLDEKEDSPEEGCFDSQAPDNSRRIGAHCQQGCAEVVHCLEAICSCILISNTFASKCICTTHTHTHTHTHIYIYMPEILAFAI